MPRYRISMTPTPASGSARVCPVGDGGGSVIVKAGAPVDVTISAVRAHEIRTNFEWFDVVEISEKPKASPLDKKAGPKPKAPKAKGSSK